MIEVKVFIHARGALFFIIAPQMRRRKRKEFAASIKKETKSDQERHVWQNRELNDKDNSCVIETIKGD